MTGITRVSKESLFSDLNNLEVVTTTSKKYADSFGFTQDEVEAALEKYGLFDKRQQAVWSLLLASGYLKVKKYEVYASPFGEWRQDYELELTNFEVKAMFRNMIRRWFGSVNTDYNDFITAFLLGDVKAMNFYMNRMTSEIFSYFDTGKKHLGTRPEHFYHGFAFCGKKVLIGTAEY